MSARRTITQADRDLARARREVYLAGRAGGPYVAPAGRTRQAQTRRTYPFRGRRATR